MHRLRGIVAILVLLNFFQPYADAKLTTLQKKITRPPSDKRLQLNDYLISGGSFVYAVCDEKTLAGQKNCTITQRKYPFDEDVHSCNITLQVKYSEDNNGISRVNARSFEEEKAIVIWAETGNSEKLNVMIIQLDSCNTSIYESDDPHQHNYFKHLYSQQIMTYDNYYDIFLDTYNSPDYEDDEKTTVRRRVHFDNSSETINNVMKNEHNGVVRFVSSISPQTPDKGYVYSTENRNDSRSLILVKPDGTERVLMNELTLQTSVNNSLITSCKRLAVHDNITCTQFNDNGEVKFNVTIDSGRNEAIETISIYTTPGGGLLLLTRSFSKYGSTDYQKDLSSYDVFKVDSEGKQMGSVSLKGFLQAEGLGHFSIFENGNDHCAFLLSRVSLRAHININVNCFTDSDFKS